MKKKIRKNQKVIFKVKYLNEQVKNYFYNKYFYVDFPFCFFAQVGSL